MELQDFIDMADNEQDLLFNEMSKTLINETLNDDYIYSIIYNEFAEAGITLKEFNYEYNIEQKKFNCDLKIDKNDINLYVLVDNLFLYGAINTTEYISIKEHLDENRELQESMYLEISKTYNKEANITLLMDTGNPLVEYILQTTIDNLLDTIFFKITKELDDKHRDYEISRILVFKEYSQKYSVDSLYSKIIQGGENLNV